MMEAVEIRKATNGMSARAADLLRALASTGPDWRWLRRRSFPPPAHHVISRGVENVMPIERVSQLFADQMARAALSTVPAARRSCTRRCPANRRGAPAAITAFGLVVQLRGVIFNEFNRGHHLAVARRLQESARPPRWRRSRPWFRD